MNTDNLPPEIVSAMFALAAVYMKELKNKEQIKQAFDQFDPNALSKVPPQEKVPEYLTIKMVGENLKVTTRTVRNLIASGHLHRVKINRCTRIPIESYRNYCEQLQEGGAPQ